MGSVIRCAERKSERPRAVWCTIQARVVESRTDDNEGHGVVDNNSDVDVGVVCFVRVCCCAFMTYIMSARRVCIIVSEILQVQVVF